MLGDHVKSLPLVISQSYFKLLSLLWKLTWGFRRLVADIFRLLMVFITSCIIKIGSYHRYYLLSSRVPLMKAHRNIKLCIKLLFLSISVFLLNGTLFAGTFRIELVSYNTADNPIAGGKPVISADGRYIAFSTIHN